MASSTLEQKGKLEVRDENGGEAAEDERVGYAVKEKKRTDFIITASHDGHVKFWKKKEDAGIGFVKHFRSHLGVIECIGISAEGALFCSVGDDQAMKVFDVVNFDMIDMLKLGFHPGQCEWIYNPGDAVSAVACSEKSTGKIFVYDGRG